MRVFQWLLRGLLFFVLFAFALNNQQDVQLHWFFGYSWQTRMVLVVLAAFALGCMAGVMAMLPSWWRHRRDARQRGPLVGDKSDMPPSQVMPADAGAPSTLGPLPFPPDMVAPRKSGK